MAITCINSWIRYLPDYKLKLWNEDNFNLDINDYVHEAYQAGKFAFVTDYVRLYALYHEGGIYMDTDVEVLKRLDRFLTLIAFMGFEGDKQVSTGIIASEKNGEFVKELLRHYDNRPFLLQDGTYDLTPNTEFISSVMTKNGFRLNNGYQVYKNCLHIFPKDYFSPMQYGKINLTGNTYCIHHFAGSWNPAQQKIKRFFFRNILGGNISAFLVKIKRNILKRSV